MVPEHLLPVWRQCMSNTTYPSAENSYETVARSATHALNNVPGSDKLQNVETTTDLASGAWDDADQGMRFGDHRCMWPLEKLSSRYEICKG